MWLIGIWFDVMSAMQSQIVSEKSIFDMLISIHLSFFQDQGKFDSDIGTYVYSVHSNLANDFFTNTQFPLFLIVERKEFHLKVISH